MMRWCCSMVGKATFCNAKISYGCWFKSNLFPIQLPSNGLAKGMEDGPHHLRGILSGSPRLLA